jgi:hypothetical protein
MTNAEAPTPKPAKPRLEKERLQVGLRGEWRDQVIEKDSETGEERLIEDTGWKANQIVTNVQPLLAGLMSNEVSFTGGILYSAQGRGDPSFDISLPTPSFSETALRDEFFRKEPDSIVFIDEDTGDPAGPGVITRVIRVKTIIEFNEANGEFIREQGLYGGTATAAADSGLLANLIFHEARFKNNTIKIFRFIQLTFDATASA